MPVRYPEVMTNSRHQVGDVVGGYVLERRLGSGASATVYLAKDGGGEPVALKLLNPGASLGEREDSDEGPGRRRLRSEALALSKLDIPGIAHVSDLEVDGVEAFLVTEYIPGLTLEEDVHTSGPWLREDVSEIAGLLSDTLTAVHARAICHRDIKPANVILGPNGPVLIDFGISFASGAQHLTQTGLVVGTPGFISPEVINGKAYDFADDWWALATTLLFLLTGRPPFGADSQVIQISRVLAGNPDVLGLDEDLAEVFREVLAPQEKGRGEFPMLLEALERVPEISPTRVQDFTDWYSLGSEGSSNGETEVLHGRFFPETVEANPEAFESGNEENLEESVALEEPRAVPFTFLALSLAWASWVPHSEIVAGVVAVAAIWVAATAGWHRQARRKILSIPAVFVKGLISGLPGMVGILVPLVASYGIGNGAEVIFPDGWPGSFEIFGTVVTQSWLARIVIAWFCACVLWILPAFAPIRTGARSVIRAFFPRIWARALLVLLALGATLAALILS